MLFFTILFTTLLTTIQGRYHERLLLNKIDSITFYRGEFTTSRRHSPIRQMSCSWGYCEEIPDTITCDNIGIGLNGDPRWNCIGRLRSGFYFRDVNVNCEGYDHAHDEYILAGSCGVEFGIEYSGYTHHDPFSVIVPLLILVIVFVCLVGAFVHPHPDFIFYDYYRRPPVYLNRRESVYRYPSSWSWGSTHRESSVGGTTRRGRSPTRRGPYGRSHSEGTVKQSSATTSRR